MVFGGQDARDAGTIQPYRLLRSGIFEVGDY